MKSVFGTPMPITRVDNWLLFPGGFSRRLTWRERYRAWRGTLELPYA